MGQNVFDYTPLAAADDDDVANRHYPQSSISLFFQSILNLPHIPGIKSVNMLNGSYKNVHIVNKKSV